MRVKDSRSLHKLTLCALFAALIAVLSPIAVPFGPIPVSLGLLGVLLTSLILPPVRALTSVTVFLLLGICGLPVFGGGGSGAMILAGPTGGYLWSYLLVSLTVSLLSRRIGQRWQNQAAIRSGFVACLVGVLLCYLCGTLQYALVMQTDPLAAIAVCVLPFLPFDVVKSLLAAYLSQKLKRILGKRL